ncbi:MAG TPA: hypothetical protein ENK51_07935 [Gammaproteobacteria bacterium]|nr:hypothetical protein [Gammaproteobacteria bacterium]
MNDNAQRFQPSPAARPDLDWSQVRETVMMLNVAVAQISNAMQDGDESVKTLTESFTAMMDNIAAIQSTLETLPAESRQRDDISRRCDAISGQMQTVIVAFQFYDKLNQRLGHLTDSLASLGGLVASPEQLYNPQAWKALQADIKSRYTLEADKAMFDAILNGASIEEALHLGRKRDESEEDIELF